MKSRVDDRPCGTDSLGARLFHQLLTCVFELVSTGPISQESGRPMLIPHRVKQHQTREIGHAGGAWNHPALRKQEFNEKGRRFPHGVISQQ
jgi:hypothetical protein